MSNQPIFEAWTRQQLEAIGGKHWSTSDGLYQRVYFNELAQLYGLSCKAPLSGGPVTARLNGGTISISQAKSIYAAVRWCKLYYDLTTNSWGRKGEAHDIMDVCVARLRARLMLAATGEAA